MADCLELCNCLAFWQKGIFQLRPLSHGHESAGFKRPFKNSSLPMWRQHSYRICIRRKYAPGFMKSVTGAKKKKAETRVSLHKSRVFSFDTPTISYLFSSFIRPTWMQDWSPSEISVNMSAIFFWISWFLASGDPNWTLNCIKKSSNMAVWCFFFVETVLLL